MLKTIAVTITEKTTARIVVIIVKLSIPFPKGHRPLPLFPSVSRLLAGRPSIYVPSRLYRKRMHM